jgi:hypothetical protein
VAGVAGVVENRRVDTALRVHAFVQVQAIGRACARRANTKAVVAKVVVDIPPTVGFAVDAPLAAVIHDTVDGGKRIVNASHYYATQLSATGRTTKKCLLGNAHCCIRRNKCHSPRPTESSYSDEYEPPATRQAIQV